MIVEILEPQLKRVFFTRGGGFRKTSKSQYLTDTETRLSIAVLFFSGADPCNIMQVHTLNLMLVYTTAFGEWLKRSMPVRTFDKSFRITWSRKRLLEELV